MQTLINRMMLPRRVPALWRCCLLFTLLVNPVTGFSEMMTGGGSRPAAATTTTTTTTASVEWVESQNLSAWMTPLDLCLLANASTAPIEDIMAGCEARVRSTPGPGGNTAAPLLPTRCRAGNSWPSKGGFCAPKDIPYAKRDNFRRAVKGYDDPSQHPLRWLFAKLSKERGALLLVGDSVMQQFYGAIACELEREGIWPDPNVFKNTDELRHVQVDPVSGQPSPTAHKVPIRFTPVYHFVNSRFDRVANASMRALHKAVDNFLEHHDSLLVFMNVGLHYVSNPIAKFDRPAYQSQMTEALQYLNMRRNAVLGSKTVRLVWRETSAQHFPTFNGYWPGVKYAVGMDVKCVPVKDSSPEGDWRNTDVRRIIDTHRLNISVVPFYHQTLPLWGQHVNGHLRDCTHLCWTPMLYQTLFHAMARVMDRTGP